MLIANGFFILFSVPAGFLCALFVTRYFTAGYASLTVMELVGFAGMAAGGFIMSSFFAKTERKKLLAAGMAAFGLLAILMGAAASFYIYLGLMAVYGIFLTMIQTAATTMLQENCDPTMIGRIFGLFGSIYSAALPIGMLMFGPLADFISLRLIMAGSGLLLVGLAFYAAKYIGE